MKKKTNYLAKAIMLSLALGVSASMVLPQSAWAESITTSEYLGLGNGGNDGKYSPLDLLNVQAAYDKGYTGKGVTVGMNDEGLDARHQELAGKTAGTPNGVAEDWTGTLDEWFITNGNHHGTHVAGIIAAKKDGVGMHGVAYDANVNGIIGYNYYYEEEQNYTAHFLENIDGHDGSVLVEKYWSSDDIKVVNCSWGSNVVTVADVSTDEEKYGARVTDQLWTKYAQEWKDSAGNTHDGKLFFFAAGNDGTFGPSAESFAYLYKNDSNTDEKDGRGARNNVISVGSLSKYVVRNSDGSITVDSSETGTNKADLLVDFSCLALGNEEKFVLGTGDSIWSVSAGTTDRYEKMSGTSMATPSVVGVAALVQQAFPYLTGKQIGDVILSTANKNVTFKEGIQVSVDDTNNEVNIYLVGENTSLTKEGIEKAVKSVLPKKSESDKADDVATKYTVRVFSDVNVESLIGQGVADAGAAVNGLATLNARRLTNEDFSDEYTTVNGEHDNKQAIYTVNTKGCNSTWSNNISEVRVGTLATNSTQSDLKDRCDYYTTGKYDSYSITWDGKTAGALTDDQKGVTLIDTDNNSEDGSDYSDYLSELIEYYNADRPSELDDLHVGLKKTGEGILILSGDNTYQGATIVDEGTLAINGSINGDAYAEGSGFLSGAGTIKGNVYNSATVGAPVDGGTLKIDGNLKLEDGSSLAYTNYNGYVGKIAVGTSGGTSAITATGDRTNLTLNPDISYKTSDKFTNTNFSNWVTLNGAATDLQVAQDEGDTVYKTDLLTARYSTANEGTISFKLENNYLNSTADENNAVRALDEVDRKRAHDAELLPLLNAKKGASRAAVGQLVNNGNAQSALAVAQSNHVGQALGQRWSQIQRAQVSVPAQVAPKSLTKQESEVPAVTVQVPVEVEPIQSMWAKMDKAWGNVGSASTNMYGLTLGYDKQYNANNRAGVFFSYAKSNFSASEVLDKQQDYRVGLYNGFHKGAQDVLVYLDFGTQRHDAERYMSRWSPDNTSEYNSRILELGAEYKYDLHAADGKIFHVSPYINGKLARYWQDAYKEGYWAGQSVDSSSSNYAATELGLEISRQFKLGSYSGRLGFKEVWTGNSTDLTYNIASTSVRNTSHATSDKHFVTASLTGTAKLNNHGWSLEGETHLEKGAHDKNYGISATLKWEW